MNTFRDRLGTVIIPEHLLSRVKDYVPPSPKVEPERPRVDAGPADWTLVKTFNSSRGSSVHRVEQKGRELRCTCKGFRIQQKGYCKHTEMVKKELGL